jgi:probable O-glycosylation ligase (exosortase A-associated)
VFRLIFVFGVIAIGAYYSLQGAFYALLFYLWNAYFRPEFWVWNDMLFSFRLSLIIGGFLLMAAVPSFSRFRWSRQMVLVALFFLQTVVSLLMSAYSEAILDFWLEFLKVVTITVLMTILIDDERRYRLTLIVIAFSLGFEAAKQGWAQFVLNPGATNNNTHVMLGDNNGVALGMIMLIPIFMALSQTAARNVQRNVYRFFIAGVFYRAVSTYSRGGFLAAGVVSLISLARAKHKIRTLVAVGVLAYAVSAVMPQSFWDRMNSITAEEDQRDASAQSRLYYWGLARDMAADAPLTGVGFNAYRYAFSRYDRLKDGEGGQRAVHSVWFSRTRPVRGHPGGRHRVMSADPDTCQAGRPRTHRGLRWAPADELCGLCRRRHVPERAVPRTHLASVWVEHRPGAHRRHGPRYRRRGAAGRAPGRGRDSASLCAAEREAAVGTLTSG